MMLGRIRSTATLFNRRLATRLFGVSTASNHRFVNRQQLPLEAGQALHETRPNLIKPGEITPGIQAIEYFERRIHLASKLPPKSCVVIAGSQVRYASGAVFYAFQQNTDMYYLTGWNEPDSVMILEKPSNNLDQVVFHLVVPPKDKFAEQWEGYRTGPEGAKDIFNADESADLGNLASYLGKIFDRNEYIYYDTPKDKTNVNDSAFFSSFFSLQTMCSGHQTIMDVIRKKGTMKKIRHVSRIIGELRKTKSPAELRIMRRAGQISGRAYNQAYANRFRNERTLQAFLEYKFLSGGCDKSAYIPVVAAGPNGLCIHYTRNDDVMYDDEMVLVDASGSLGDYCTDISRTWPVEGKFSDPQRDLYEAVLNVQKKCIDLCKAHNGYSIHEIHEKSLEFMTIELRNVGFRNIQKWEVNKLYPHYIGHHLGLDVHDTPDVSRHEPLDAGQVITIEPGVYVPDQDCYPSYFRNVGIRIEDDIAIGKHDYTNLTVEAAKEVVDIESIAQNGVTTKIEEDVISPLKN